MSPRPNPSLPAAAHVLKATRWLLAALLLALTPTSHADDRRDDFMKLEVEAWKLSGQGKFEEAEQQYRAALVLWEAVFGPEDADTIRSRLRLAIYLRTQNKQAAAEQELRGLLDTQEHMNGVVPRQIFLTCLHLTETLRAQGKLKEARTFAVRAKEGYRSEQG